MTTRRKTTAKSAEPEAAPKGAEPEKAPEGTEPEAAPVDPNADEKAAAEKDEAEAKAKAAAEPLADPEHTDEKAEKDVFAPDEQTAIDAATDEDTVEGRVLTADTASAPEGTVEPERSALTYQGNDHSEPAVAVGEGPEPKPSGWTREVPHEALNETQPPNTAEGVNHGGLDKHGQPAPAAAPLDAPKASAAPKDDKAPEAIPAGAVGVELLANSGAGSVLVLRGDELPDADNLFEPVQGSVVRCLVRLSEATFTGPHSNPIRRLVMPAGQLVDVAKAEQIKATVRQQAAAYKDAQQG